MLLLTQYFLQCRFTGSPDSEAPVRITSLSTTEDTLREIGARLRAFRLQQNLTILDLARRAGVGARTLGRAELGDNTNLDTVIRVLRALGRLDALDAFLPEPLPSPLHLDAGHSRPRLRARTPRTRRPRTTDG